MKTIKLYRQRFKALLFLGFSLISISLLSQTTTITGNVISDDGMPLPGVSILVKNTANGTQTDFDGKYEIDFDSKRQF